MPDVLVVVAVLFFAAIIIVAIAWVAVQAGHRSVEMQQDFSKQLVAGLANKAGLAGAVMGMTIDPEGREANGRYPRDNGQHRMSESFPQPRPTADQSR